MKQQGYSAAFDMEFLNSSKLKIVFFICYSVPRKIATDSGPKYEWDLVTRDHCTKGCPVSDLLLRMPCRGLTHASCCCTAHALKGRKPSCCAFEDAGLVLPGDAELRRELRYLFPCRGPYSGPSSGWASWASGPMCPTQRLLTPIRPRTPSLCTCPLMNAAHTWATARPPSSGGAACRPHPLRLCCCLSCQQVESASVHSQEKPCCNLKTSFLAGLGGF